MVIWAVRMKMVGIAFEIKTAFMRLLPNEVSA